MKDELYSELVAGVRKVGAILRGDQTISSSFAVELPGIKNIRDKFGLIQEHLAMLLGVSVRTLRNWEHGREDF